jgi:DNA-binding PadR family transcriptional regulator
MGFWRHLTTFESEVTGHLRSDADVVKIILGFRMPDGVSGRDLRNEINARRLWKVSAPTFYKLMADLEDRGVVRGHYRDVAVHGVTVKERYYTLPKDKS